MTQQQQQKSFEELPKDGERGGISPLSLPKGLLNFSLSLFDYFFVANVFVKALLHIFILRVFKLASFALAITFPLRRKLGHSTLKQLTYVNLSFSVAIF